MEYSMIACFQQFVLGNSFKRPIRSLSKLEHEHAQIQLGEEVAEIAEAFDKGDIASMIDGYLDILYFTYGKLYSMGLREEEIKLFFTFVHMANMEKKKGENPKRPGYGEHDATKPSGWEDPVETIRRYLDDHQD